MQQVKEVVIVDAARTPIGSFGGDLATIPASRLGATVIKALLERSGLPGDRVDEVIMGNVLPAGQGQAPARQAAIYAGLPESVECMTINKVCGSGLKSVMLAAQAIALGDAEIVVAGGMESMSLTPYYLPTARKGFRMGHQQAIDGMIYDGLWDPYNDFHMGNAGELCATAHGFTREMQDTYTLESYRRAQQAITEERFAAEIVPVEIPQRKGDPVVITRDQEPFALKAEKVPLLRPAFRKDGTVTAANASKINDGAAALLVMSTETAAKLKLQPLARIRAQASFAQQPEQFTTAPASAVRKALDKAGLQTGEIDFWEINEAFAVVTMVNNRLLELDPARVNVRGGAVALGHPIGASGARVLTTLLYTMRDESARYGVATLCIGGGEGAALVVERI
ncbi:MAG: thiolase family protein [Candidatus Delongbacteria bacterium]|nr:thiolase family protein [Candidatus Delongbacteria bacterium]